MELEKIFNADDFGMTPGVNQAIAKAYHEGILNSTSIMINLNFVQEALDLKANDADLETKTKTGKIDDLTQTNVIVFNCGDSSNM